ncbi:hypothetical protein ACFY9C_07115 [Streptomyces filamentosus]|uniref:hypothetical protein n=1 Tax=Streptomyces filamentosus TaxID=67294 RepID=UPI0036EC18AF
MRRWGTVAVGLGVVLGVLAGCGSQKAGSGQGDPEAEAGWVLSSPIRIDGVRTAGGGRALVVGAEVPDGERECVRGLRGTFESAGHGTVRVSVTYESPAADREYGCTGTRRVETTVELDGPLGSRKVLVNNWTAYTPAGAVPPALRPCGENGCDPTPPRCAPSSYQQAVDGTDVPEHTGWEERGCDGTWLVLDLSSRMGPVCGGVDDGCSSGSVSQRWFYRAEPEGWRAVAMNGGAGCAGVRAVLPDLPERLCASLPRLGRG